MQHGGGKKRKRLNHPLPAVRKGVPSRAAEKGRESTTKEKERVGMVFCSSSALSQGKNIMNSFIQKRREV